jgi:ribosomal protein L32
MRALLAHQGGWDEILLTVGLVLGMLGLSRWRRRSRIQSDPTSALPASGGNVCAYCGASLTPGDLRCPSCGFRTRAGS